MAARTRQRRGRRWSVGRMGVWSSILLMSLLVGMLGVSAWERHRPRSEARPSGDDQASFRIEVLNGNGRAHEAQALTTHLRGHGYRVDQVGNAGRWDYPHTLVVDRRGDPVRARGVASAVGRGSVVLQRADDGCEVRVILGHDWSPQGDR